MNEVPERENFLRFDKKKVWLRALNSSLGFLIFGYSNTIFTSSQDCVSSILNWGDDKELYIAVFSALIPLGALVGSMFTGFISKYYGKRRNIMNTNLITILSSLLMFWPNTFSFALGRLLSGFCLGSYSVLCPQYVTEFTPKQVRGKLGNLNQLFVIIGILISFTICLLIPIGECSQEIKYYVFSIFAVPGVLALLQFLFFVKYFKRESPFWLIALKENVQAEGALASIYNKSYAEAQMEKICNNEPNSFQGEISSQYTLYDILTCKKGTTKQVRVSVIYNALAQFSGINAILAYMTALFQEFSAGVFMSRVLTVIVTLIRIITLITVLPMIDKVGRKKITVICQFLLCLFAGIISLSLIFLANTWLLTCCLCIYLIIYGNSIGSIVWIFSSEVLNDKGMALCMSVNWICCFIVVLFFPFLLSGIGLGNTFALIAAVNLFGVIYFFFDMIETKGLNKVEIVEIYSKRR